MTNGRAYEDLVHTMMQRLSLDVARVGSGINNKIAGVSGYAHQIDISIDTSTALQLVECKYWKRRVGVQAVLTLLARLIDIREAQPGVSVSASIVSTRSATVGATILARHYGVSIDTVRSIDDYVVRLRGRVFVLKSDNIGISDGLIAKVVRG